jgi:hypothetical protein
MKDKIIKVILDKCCVTTEHFSTGLGIPEDEIRISTPTRNIIQISVRTPIGPRYFEIKVSEKM